MPGAMRYTAMALAAVSLTLILVFSGVIYVIGSNPIPTKVSAYTATTTSQPVDPSTQNEPVVEGAEVIDDQDVPLAAAPSSAAATNQSGIPTSVVLGVLLGAAGGYLYLHLHRINANIKVMRRSIE